MYPLGFPEVELCRFESLLTAIKKKERRKKGEGENMKYSIPVFTIRFTENNGSGDDRTEPKYCRGRILIGNASLGISFYQFTRQSGNIFDHTII